MASRMRISSSQHSTYLRCHRLWWFQSVQKLPTPPRAFFDFGTILHEVCERYLLATDLGRVPPIPIWWATAPGFSWLTDVLAGQVPGHAIQLYPSGWETTEGRTITPVESHLIHKLIEKAISEGILERQDGRKIEHWFSYELLEGVDMRGMIDVLNIGEVQDHKSTKAMKWAETPESLESNVQMLNYAKVLLDMQLPRVIGGVTLRHNVYCKNPDKLEVRKVETTVSQEAIWEHHESLVVEATEMKDLKENGPDLDDWIEVEGPSQPNACSAYGGCPMRSICGFKSSPEAYIKRVERQIKNHDPRQKPVTWADRWGRLEKPQQGTEDMSKDIFAKQRAKKAEPAAPATPEAVEAPQIDGSEKPLMTPREIEDLNPRPSTALPWALLGCRACGMSPTPGLNTKGNPCFICRSLNKKAGNRTDLDYVVERDPDGTLNWEAKDGSGQGQANLAPTSEPKASVKQDLTPATPTPVEEVTAAIDEANANAVKVEAQKAAKSADKVLPEPKSDEQREEEKVASAAKALAARQAKAKAKAEAKAAEPDDESDAEEQPKRKGRQPRGYRLYVDCMPLGGKTVIAEVLFDDMASMMAESQGAKSYYDLNPFDRRDLWHKLPEGAFQEQFGSCDIVVRNPNGSPDLKAFVEALMSAAKAGHVVVGMS